MSLPRPSKANVGQLPKSVKVRSTCNACQQAKIRCSHEKPSCRRCQKHRIDCIYSMSRRLGRPAKKRELRPGAEDQNTSPVTETEDHHGRDRKTRKAPKQKCQNTKLAAEMQPSYRGCGDAPKTGSFSRYFQKPSSTENLADDSGEVLQIDFASETWLQELMSTDFKESLVDTAFNSSYEDFEPENSPYPALPLPFPTTDSYFCSTTSASDSTVARTIVDNALYDFHDLAHAEAGQATMFEVMNSGPPISDALCRGEGLKPEPNSWVAENMPTTSASTNRVEEQYTSFQSPELSHGGGIYTPEELNIGTFPDMTGCRCGCYLQAMSELVRTGLQTTRNDPSNISCILANQKMLQRQAESILQCEACLPSEARANVLMVIIVSIDSLLTTLEATASVTSGLHDGLPPANIHSGCKRQRDLNGGFLSHIDACPLLVGSFRVPNEEKTWFIRQMLQARLSMLLLTIRRIRDCTQQQLAVTPSRGRLMMIMETDRRLQLIIMKIKMMTG